MNISQWYPYFFLGIYLTMGFFSFLIYAKDREQKEFLALGLLIANLAVEVIKSNILRPAGLLSMTVDFLWTSVSIFLNAFFAAYLIWVLYGFEKWTKKVFFVLIAVYLIGALLPLTLLINREIRLWYNTGAVFGGIVWVFYAGIALRGWRAFKPKSAYLGFLTTAAVAYCAYYMVRHFAAVFAPPGVIPGGLGGIFIVIWAGWAMIVRLVDLNIDLRAEVKAQTERIIEENSESAALIADLGHANEPLSRDIALLGAELAKSEAALSSSVKQYLNLVLQSCRRLDNYLSIANLRQILSQFSADAPINVSSTLAKKAPEYATAAQAKGLGWDYSHFKDCYAAIDPQALILILDNFIDNACRFTESGSICLEIKSDEKKITISVADSGPGVQPSHRSRIFNLHFRSGSQAGSGIGLYLAKETAENFGGRIQIENIESGGSRFSLILPAIEQPDDLSRVNEMVIVDSIFPWPSDKSIKALIIDDEKWTRVRLKSAMSSLFDTLAVSTASAALDCLGFGDSDSPNRFEPELIVCDVLPPEGELGGFELYKRLRSTRFREAGWIFISRKTPDYAELPLNKRVKFLPKPINVNQLLLFADQVLQVSRNSSEAALGRFFPVKSRPLDMAGSSTIRERLQMIDQAWQAGKGVVITGDYGSGRHSLARLHLSENDIHLDRISALSPDQANDLKVLTEIWDEKSDKQRLLFMRDPECLNQKAREKLASLLVDKPSTRFLAIAGPSAVDSLAEDWARNLFVLSLPDPAEDQGFLMAAAQQILEFYIKKLSPMVSYDPTISPEAKDYLLSLPLPDNLPDLKRIIKKGASRMMSRGGWELQLEHLQGKRDQER